MTNDELNQRRQAATPRGVGVMCNFFADRAENATVWDVEGRAYTDFAAGIAVLNTGHRHPRVVQAVQQQLASFTHTAYQIVPYAGYVTLAERINALVPITGVNKTAFFTTGAEAVENAVKIARCHTGRPGLIAFSGAFHGRTLLGMALTGKVSPYKVGTGSQPADIYHVPFPDALHGIDTAQSLKALQTLFKTDIDPSRVAAILIEPVQGEGGFLPAPADLMQGLRALCDRHGIVLIADEIQSGFGRSGKWFAMDHHDVQPDLITMAKSLAGGLPLSAVCGRAHIMDGVPPGGLGGTYAGNPLAVAAALAVLDVMADERLCERAEVLGQALTRHLLALRPQCAALAEVRGPGSMVAAEFCDPATGLPSPAAAQRVQQRALASGLLLLTCGMYGNVIRFLYPLTIPQEQFDAALVTLAYALTD